MIRLAVHMALSLVLMGQAGAAQGAAKDNDEVLTLPSGLEARFHEMIWDEPGQGLVYRFRFVARAFTQDMAFDILMADLEHLCTSYAIPHLASMGPTPHQVIISLANEAAEFGQYDPDVTQVFEAYRIEDGTCIWEVF